MTTANASPSAGLLDATRTDAHPRCIVCGQREEGLGLEFDLQADGSVCGHFDCPSYYEGYNGMLHGGVISAIADGAMTNCLFAHGIKAVTAELTVRYRHPIALGEQVTVAAKVVRWNDPLFAIEAELSQADQLKAKATGKFMRIR